jgi:hypothetical protein
VKDVWQRQFLTSPAAGGLVDVGDVVPPGVVPVGELVGVVGLDVQPGRRTKTSVKTMTILIKIANMFLFMYSLRANFGT